MKIHINTRNIFLSNAIKTMLQDYFCADASIFSSDKVPHHNVAEYDVIILSLLPGEQYICHPYLQHRKEGSKLILLVDDKTTAINMKLPHCLSDAGIIDKKTSIINFYYIFSSLLNQKIRSQGTNVNTDLICDNCPCGSLSRLEFKVSRCFMKGITTSEIASELELSEKTIYALKRKVMSRFRLNSDQELYALFRGLRLTHSLPLIKE